ncbi:MAG TPA: ABC transporter substrate-binding protein [bacterium]|nr:ABC transporter substrate-binding protein [bacterium]
MGRGRRRFTRRAFMQGLGAGAAAAAGGFRWGGAVRAAGTVTLSFWNGLTGPDGRVMEGIVADFMAANPSIKIEQQQMQWTDFHTKMLTAIPAGQAPDVAIMHTYEKPRYVQSGALTEFSDAELEALGFRQKDFAARAWDGGMYQGKRYSVPLDIHAMCLYINNPLFKSVGLWADGKPKAPTTQAEFLAACQTLTHGDHYGVAWLQRGVGWAFQMLLWQNGGDMFDAQGEPTLDSPAAIEAMQFIQDLNKKYHYTPEGITGNPAEAFQTSKIGMAVHGDWLTPAFVAANMDFTVVPAPTFFKRRVVWAGSHQFYLPVQRRPDNAKREAALVFIKWVSDHSLAWAQGGHIPARTALTATPGFRARKQAALLADAPYWHFMPAVPKILVEESLITAAQEQIFLGRATPKEALQALNDQIKRARI